MILPAIIKSLFAANLPSVAQAVMDKGLGYVEEKLGIEIKPNPDGSLSADQLLEIRLAAMKHEEFKIEQQVKNTADARAMQMHALKQEDKFSKRFVYYFATVWSIFAMLYLSGITFMHIPEANQRLVDTITGFLIGTLIASIFNFFFGSSLGSMNKNKMLARGLSRKGEIDDEIE